MTSAHLNRLAPNQVGVVQVQKVGVVPLLPLVDQVTLVPSRVDKFPVAEVLQALGLGLWFPLPEVVQVQAGLVAPAGPDRVGPITEEELGLGKIVLLFERLGPRIQIIHMWPFGLWRVLRLDSRR